MTADVPGEGVTDMLFLSQVPDGTPVGSIVSSGICGAAPPPGSPNDATGHNLAVVGGTGAFVGVRGQVTGYTIVPGQYRSVLEDPANRRTHPGAFKGVRYIHLIPHTLPEVMSLPTGPAIFHGDDFSPVTAEKPARAGERLIMSVSGLGPVKPNLDPGKPFPAWVSGKEHLVNSPVEVTVGGKAPRCATPSAGPGRPTSIAWTSGCLKAQPRARPRWA